MTIVEKKKLQKIGLDYLFALLTILFIIFVIPK